MKPDVEAFFDERTSTITYVVADPDAKVCAVIDSVLDYDPGSGRTSTESADRVGAHVGDNGLEVVWILETHAHADHLTGARHLKERLGGATAIGAEILSVQKTFAELFNLGPEFPADGSQWDRLLGDGDSLELGGLTIEAMHTPGHTPACTCYLIGDAVFTGDTVFMPDFGTARCDFPGGNAATLYASIRRILELAPETRVFVGHDYAPGDRAFAWESTVAEERARNIHVHDGVGEDEFVRLREGRDAELEVPRLILPALQVNIRGGALPPPEDNGVSYLKLPLNAL